MKRKVKLIWHVGTRYQEEICYLLSDDAVLVDAEGNEIPRYDADYIKREGFVAFEDSDGQFFIRADQIDSIDPMEN